MANQKYKKFNADTLIPVNGKGKLSVWRIPDQKLFPTSQKKPIPDPGFEFQMFMEIRKNDHFS